MCLQTDPNTKDNDLKHSWMTTSPTAVGATATLLSLATTALAETPPPPDEVTEIGGEADDDGNPSLKRYDWSIGAGIGVTGVGGLGASGAPMMSALFERRLGDHIWPWISGRSATVLPIGNIPTTESRPTTPPTVGTQGWRSRRRSRSA